MVKKKDDLHNWEKILHRQSKNITKYLIRAQHSSRQDLYYNILKPVRIGILEMAMKHCRGNQLQSAALLGISRGTLRNYLECHFDVSSWPISDHKLTKNEKIIKTSDRDGVQTLEKLMHESLYDKEN